MQEIANIRFIENFLDKETIEKLKTDIRSSSFNNVNSTKTVSMSCIGSAIEYLFGNDKKSFENNVKYLNDNYEKNVIEYNQQLSPKFDYLYEILKNKLSYVLNIPCEYRENILKPHIRIMYPEYTGVFRDNEVGFHYDSNILFLDWEKYIGKKIQNIISFTISIENPDHSGFDWVGGTETNDPNVYNSLDLNTTHYIGKSKNLPDYLKDNKVAWTYKEGDCVLQWNFVLHRIGKISFSSMDQKRITIQGCGVHDGEKIWLSS
jgi:hypothetical protein